MAHPTLLEELAAFRKAELLQALRAGAPGTTIHDIRFRVGPIDGPDADEAPAPAPERPRPASEGAGRRRRRKGRGRAS